MRFFNFLGNLKLVDERNLMERMANGTAIHGITRFSDLSVQEFEQNYLRSDPSYAKADAPRVTIKIPVQESAGLIDWTNLLRTHTGER